MSLPPSSYKVPYLVSFGLRFHSNFQPYCLSPFLGPNNIFFCLLRTLWLAFYSSTQFWTDLYLIFTNILLYSQKILFINFKLHTDRWPCVNWHKGFNKTKINLFLEEEGSTSDSPSVQSGKAKTRFWCLIFLFVCWYLLTNLLSPLSLLYEMSFWVMGRVENLKKNGSVCGKMKRG